MKRKIFLISGIITFSVFLMFCDKDRGINLFTVNQDIEFGQQMKSEIEANPSEYPVLSPSGFPEAYQHLNRIKDKLLQNSEDFKYKDRFDWEVYIIADDDVLNAFACPGGYMYYYTGLIKFLDNESQFAGVMAHEMAHVDLRHSTRQLTKVYGFEILLSALLGDDPGTLTEIVAGLAKGLAQLAFSRDFEYQADEFGVKFMSDTDYDPLGIAGFFEKLESEQVATNRMPAFLSTHPSPEDRVEQIEFNWEAEGSKIGNEYQELYQDFKNSLP